MGPSQWGLGNDSSPVRDDAKLALEYLFQVRIDLPVSSCFSFWILTASIAQLEVLDVYLPLLTDASAPVSMRIAQPLGAVLRAPSHPSTVAEWVPPAERTREAPRGRRRAPLGTPRDRSSRAVEWRWGWVARRLTT